MHEPLPVNPPAVPLQSSRPASRTKAKWACWVGPRNCAAVSPESSPIVRLSDQMLSLPGDHRLSIVSCSSVPSRVPWGAIDQRMLGVCACAAGPISIKAAVKRRLIRILLSSV